MRWAAVLAGGSGTRFWPLSTAAAPKQFLPLAGPQPLIVDAVSRLRGLIPEERTLVITAAAYVDETRRLLSHLPAENILGEPQAASTGPALAWATHVAQQRDPEASVLSLHADWFVGNALAFRETADAALDVAERFDTLVTVGIVPTRPDVGYGYIVPGEQLDGDARRVDRFEEKPDGERATALIEQGALWNSGLFAWRAERFAAESASLAPEIGPFYGKLTHGDITGFFAAVTPIAVDKSHFERSERVAVVPGRFEWDDVGTWAALGRVRSADPEGNVAVGDDVFVHDAANCVVWSEDGPVVLDGVEDVVVVRARGIVLVTTRARAAQLKELLEHLPPELRDIS
jgi:mannose-1-phosphate guanylyltransferase